MKIAILGAGTYGSYIVNSIQEKYPNAQITVFDVGTKQVKSESEIGYLSSIRKSMYKGLTHGRYFGWGGASHKWGGQLLTYTENDFKHPDSFMQDVIALDKKYKDKVLSKFRIENKFAENQLSDGLFTKTGVWLSMLHRNFFHWFKIDKRKNVKVLSNVRIIRLESGNNKQIEKVVYLENKIEKTAVFDYYFLTTGAFESARILMSSKLIKDKVFFSDHLSQKMFKVKGSTVINGEDFVFRMRGTSLITKRIIGEINDISFYIHPVFNLKFPFFELLKEILFYRNFSFKKITNYITTIIKDIPHIIGFVWSVLILRRMYVMNNEWYLYIDIENPTKDSFISLSDNVDKYGVPGLDVFYNVGEDAVSIYKQAQKIALEYLKKNNVDFDIVSENISIDTCEDIYHPYGMYEFENVNNYFNRWENMLVVNTGILSRSGGINPTAAVLPLIDEFVDKKLGSLC